MNFLYALLLGGVLLLSGAQGYEGQPGNQSSGSNGGGQTGYEGQPGNQSGNH